MELSSSPSPASATITRCETSPVRWRSREDGRRGALARWPICSTAWPPSGDAPRSGLVRTAPISDALSRGGLRLGGRWLELGAGTGVGTRIMAPAFRDAGGSLIALDLALRMLRESPTRAAPLVQGDASSLPFAPGAFDGVAMINMLLFPEEVERVVAANGGQLLWINTSGDRTPIHLSPEDFLAALPGVWSAQWARSGTGFWVVATRSLF